MSEPIEWARLRSYASELDLEMQDSADTFTLMGHGKAITFPYTADGREQAFEWIEKLEEEEYE